MLCSICRLRFANPVYVDRCEDCWSVNLRYRRQDEERDRWLAAHEHEAARRATIGRLDDLEFGEGIFDSPP